MLWGKTAETLSQYLLKGKQVYIEGRLQTRQYEKDGQKHFSTEIKVDHVTLLDGGRTRRESLESEPAMAGVSADDIEF